MENINEAERVNVENNNRPLKILIISIGHLIHDIYSSFLSPILPILISRFNLSYSSAGLISVILRLPSLFNPFIGAYADRTNLKYIVIMAPTITAISMCLIGSAPNYITILLLAFIAGIGSSCFHVPSPILLKQFSGSRIGAGMSSFMIGGELARTIGPVVVLGAISIWSLNGLYNLIPMGILISLVLYWSFRKTQKRTSIQEHKIGGSIIATVKSDSLLFFSIFGILLSKSFISSTIAAYLPTYLSAKGESIWFSGIALSIVEGSAVAGVFLSGTISDRIGCKKMLIFLTVFAPIIMLLFIYSKGWLFIVSLVFIGVIGFSSTPVILALIQRRDFAYPSVANGIYMSLSFLLGSSMILLGGKLSDMIGIEATFRCFSLFSFIGVPFAFLLRDSK